MSRLPGAPLGADPVSIEQARALTAALERLFSAPVATGTAERTRGPSTMRCFVREWVHEECDVRACLDPGLVDTGNAGFDRNPAGSTEDQAQHDISTLSRPPM